MKKDIKTWNYPFNLQYHILLRKIHKLNLCSDVIIANTRYVTYTRYMGNLLSAIADVISPSNILLDQVDEDILLVIYQNELWKTLREIKLQKLIYFCQTGKELKLESFEKCIDQHQEMYDNILNNY